MTPPAETHATYADHDGLAVVVGAGVSGLSCAIRLLEAGFGVRVWAREIGRTTTSAVAAAIWYPYRAEPVDLVLRWGSATLSELVRLAGITGTGVRVVPGVEVFRQRVPDPWWRDAVPGFRRARPGELPAGYTDGFALELPVADMGMYLPWLEGRVAQLGGKIEQRAVTSLAEALDHASLVVNCCGLGAREVVGDESVYAVRGQVVRVVASDVDRWVIHEADEGMAYVVPRLGMVVLGGTAEVGVEELAPDPAEADAIVERCRALEPRLAGAERIGDAVGLRPCRPAVRLEAEPVDGGLVIHDYGHGGAGVTLSWGCAADVAALAVRSRR